jgi:hypothetical protein
MPNLNITRGPTAPRLTRGHVTAGQVFRTFKRDGSLGRKEYAAIGENGRSYSVNLASRELAGTAKKDRQVQVIGKWQMKETLSRALRDGTDVVKLADGSRLKAVRRTTRGDVKGNELFVAADMSAASTVYAHVGTRKDGKVLSLNTKNGNHAITSKLSRPVVVVGTYQMDVTLSQ